MSRREMAVIKIISKLILLQFLGVKLNKEIKRPFKLLRIQK